MKPDEKECPFCAEVIKAKAKVCKHCGRDLVQADSAGKALDPNQVASLKAAATAFNSLARIHFTGFDEDDKPRLFRLAEAIGFRPVQSGRISPSLSILVYGDTPGPKKMNDAKKYGITTLPLAGFLKMVKEAGVSVEDDN